MRGNGLKAPAPLVTKNEDEQAKSHLRTRDDTAHANLHR